MITPAEKNDYLKILGFETAVFRVPFLTLMPKLYKNKERCISCHRVLKSDGKIIGAYAAYKNRLTAKCGELNAVGIGSVAVSKSHRNEGIMSQMMQYSEEEAKRDNIDIGYLSGFRHRYERFGYVPCGEKYIYDVTSHYIKHHKNGAGFTFTPLKKSRERLGEVVTLFEKQPLHFERSKADFTDIAATWSDRCFVITNEEGAFSGYLIANISLKEITELCLCDTRELSDVLTAFAGCFSKKDLTVTLYPWQEDMIRELSAIGEHFKVQVSAMMKFFSFKRPIEVLMNEKLRHHDIPGGILIIDIDGERLKISVSGGICVVTETVDKPDVVLGYTEAAVALTTRFGDIDNSLFRAWSPICTIGIPHVDMI